MKKILITLLLLTASTFIYSQSMNLNNNKIRIVDSTMGLGISPTSRLHVFGNGTASNLFKLDNNRDTEKDSSIIIKANGGVILGDSSWYLNGNGVNYGVSESRVTIIGGVPLRLLNSHNKGYTSLKWSARTDKDTIADYAQIMGGVMRNTFNKNCGDLSFATNGVDGMGTRMYIDSSGYVGIGTTTPTYRLDMFGNGGTGNLLKVSNDINSTYDSTFVVNKDGKVGIGTTTPKDYLDINGNITFPNNKYIFWNAYNKGGTIYQRDISGACVLMYQKTGNSDKLFNIDITGANDEGNDTPITGPIRVLSVRTNAEINIHEEIMWRDSLGDYKKGTTLSDDEAYALPTNISWKGEIDVDSLGYTLFTAQIRCDANGTPYLEGVSWKRWSSITYVEVGSTDGYLNITDGGSGMVITNTLGYTIKATLRFRTKQ